MKTKKPTNDTEIAVLENEISNTKINLDRIERLIISSSENLSTKISDLAKDIIELRKESWLQFKWLVGIFAPFLLGLFGIITNILFKLH